MMAKTDQPQIIVLAGPNGAGKTTSAKRVLRGVFKVDGFVNADVIAQGLSGFAPETTALAAGRIMLLRLQELAAERSNFAFETTLASRTFAPWIAELISQGFEFRLLFFWLPSADMAVARVAQRVGHGGHNVPAETVRRRYRAGLKNFFSLYQPMATSWLMFDNRTSVSRLIASGQGDQVRQISDADLWQEIMKYA